MENTTEMPNKLDDRFQHSTTAQDMLEKGAILQRDGTYAIAPTFPVELLPTRNFVRIANIAKNTTVLLSK